MADTMDVATNTVAEGKAVAKAKTGQETTQEEGRNERLMKLGVMRATLKRLLDAGSEDVVVGKQSKLVEEAEEELGLKPGEEIKLNGDKEAVAGELETETEDEGDEEAAATTGKKATRVTVKKGGSKECLCGCGKGNNPGSKFNMGHDAKLKSQLRQIETGKLKFGDLAPISQSALRGKTFDLFPEWLADKDNRMQADKEKKEKASNSKGNGSKK
jgi:hypothetical protein